MKYFLHQISSQGPGGPVRRQQPRGRGQGREPPGGWWRRHAARVRGHRRAARRAAGGPRHPSRPRRQQPLQQARHSSRDRGGEEYQY